MALVAGGPAWFDDGMGDPTSVPPTERSRDAGRVPPPTERLIELPSGKRLLVRDVADGDTDAIEALYERLDVESRYRRFFTTVPPGRSHFERLVRIADRGGCCLVAFDVTDRQDVGHGLPPVVAEADFELLPNGNAEFAITVERTWRGWLGPYLLGALRERAHLMGIPNLEAEILTCNRPMRAITRYRGEALMPTSDWQTARVVIGATGATPTWPRSPMPSVLLELTTVQPDAATALVARGYETLMCTGRRAGAPPCPLLEEGEDCPLARDADVVVVAVRDADERERLLAGHRSKHPDVPVVAVDLPPGRPLDPEALVQAADRVRRRR